MTERRYREEEVQKILELATREDAAGPQARAAAGGLTLADIQSIALEVGVAPEAIARAATSLDVEAAPKPRRSWGMPVEVGRTVALPRALTDDEWERLVAELRATFGASGRVVSHRGHREWANGNLHAFVEPADDGYRLRIGTVKGDAAGINALGATAVAAGALVLGAGAMVGGFTDAVLGPIVLLASGAGAFAANLVRLPRWAQRRRSQMEHIEARALAIMGAPARSGGA